MGPIRIGAEAAWSRDVIDSSDKVLVAILDTGIDENHPDLKAKISNARSFIGSEQEFHDEFGHGTHVAGIAAASADNREGIAGMAWKSSVVPVRVKDAAGNDGQGSVE